MSAKAHLKRIRLELARTKEHPEGSARHGYEFVAPLDATNHLDAELWRAERKRCVVRRFWGDEPDEHGRLTHRPGGAQGATWGFDYDPDVEGDEEAGWRLGGHAFTPGEYVSVRDDEGVLRTFRIVSVAPA